MDLVFFLLSWLFSISHLRQKLVENECKDYEKKIRKEEEEISNFLWRVVKWTIVDYQKS